MLVHANYPSHALLPCGNSPPLSWLGFHKSHFISGKASCHISCLPVLHLSCPMNTYTALLPPFWKPRFFLHLLDHCKFPQSSGHITSMISILKVTYLSLLAWIDLSAAHLSLSYIITYSGLNQTFQIVRLAILGKSSPNLLQCKSHLTTTSDLMIVKIMKIKLWNHQT